MTVLFADLVGYTALSAQVGEEGLFALMDELYELLIHEVHRYEGTVNELTGDRPGGVFRRAAGRGAGSPTGGACRPGHARCGGAHEC